MGDFSPERHNPSNGTDPAEDVFSDAMEREEVPHVFSHSPRSLMEDKKYGKGTDEADAAAETSTMEEDVFSIIFVSPVSSYAFWYAIFIFVVQMAILILSLINSLKDPDPDQNWIKVPPYTEVEVKLAQFIALLISVMVSDDIISSLDVLLLRYDPAIRHTFKDATYPKWAMSHFLRFVEGFLGLAVAYVFIVQSTDVLALFLDFSVVQFVSELDNVGFYLANKGYLPMRDVKEITETISDTQMTLYPRRVEDGTRSCRKLVQIGVFYSLVMILYGLWITTMIKQSVGVYFQMECQRIHVVLPDMAYDRFFKSCLEGVIGDDCDVDGFWVNRRSQVLKYPYFNGLYVAETMENGALKTKDHRPIYTQTLAGDNNFGGAVSNPPGVFRYCKKEEAWIFTIPGVSKGANANDCSWLLKSPETDVLSLNDVPEGDWKVWTGTIDEASIDLTCAECTGEELAEEQTGDIGCNFHGTCPHKNRTCECEPGFVGVQCSGCIDCIGLRMIGDSPEVAELNKEYPGTLRRLDKKNGKIFEIFDRPVFYLLAGEGDGEGEGEASNRLLVTFYWADRYAMWDFADRVIWKDRNDQEDQLIEIFETLHPLWGHSDDNTDPLFITERTEFRDRILGLKWKRYSSYVETPDFVEDYFRFKYDCDLDNEGEGTCFRS